MEQTTVLIEGWRGIHQSLALVNQYHLVEFARYSELTVFHRDLPFSNPRWYDAGSQASFPDHYAKCILGYRPPDGQPVDTVYRLGIPFQPSSVSASKRLTFIVSEFGLRQFQFADPNPLHFCRDQDRVVTPSQWSKMKLMEYGFPEQGIVVVPHGVDPALFYPLSAEERNGIRGELELQPDEFVFLNLGSLTREKGLELLLHAFRVVREKYDNARLLLKDTRSLYGLSLEEFLGNYMGYFGPLPEATLQSIFQVPSSLSIGEMRLLYGAADVYVSPYRAEGFNLPVLEALACHLPAIVTDGGATDDFCPPELVEFIEAKQVANACVDYFESDIVPGYHLEPKVDHLVELMTAALIGQRKEIAHSESVRDRLLRQFSWKAVTRQLVGCF